MTIIRLVTIAAAIIVLSFVVGWSLAEFDNLRARLALREVEIANASRDQVPAPTNPGQPPPMIPDLKHRDDVVLTDPCIHPPGTHPFVIWPVLSECSRPTLPR
jgi:hypothetical protein